MSSFHHMIFCTGAKLGKSDRKSILRIAYCWLKWGGNLQMILLVEHKKGSFMVNITDAPLTSRVMDRNNEYCGLRHNSIFCLQLLAWVHILHKKALYQHFLHECSPILFKRFLTPFVVCKTGWVKSISKRIWA